MDPSVRNVLLDPPTDNQPILPNVGFKTSCKDFVVEEVPAYLPDGSGEHLFLWMEKTDISAGHLLDSIAKALKVSPRDIGVAGQKDRRAITRQFVSVPQSCKPRLSELDSIDGVQLLAVSAHGNKLRTGHLTANRFEILLRPTEGVAFAPNAVESVRERLTLLEETGIPNYFGPQRFGHEGRTVDDGIVFLAQPPPRSRKKSRFLRKLLPSAVQSAVFNLTLAARVTNATFRSVLCGDVVCRVGGSRPFSSESLDDPSGYLPMGPMPGPKMIPATADAASFEAAAIESLNLSAAAFEDGRKTPGTRRKMIEFPQKTSVHHVNEGMRLCFELPPGCYATVLLREIAGTLIQP